MLLLNSVAFIATLALIIHAKADEMDLQSNYSQHYPLLPPALEAPIEKLHEHPLAR